MFLKLPSNSYSFIRLFGYLFIWVFVYWIILAPGASAQEAFNVTASPHFFDINLTPNGTFTQKIRIRNNNDTVMPLTVDVKKLVPQEDGSFTLADFQPQDDYAKWLKVSVASVAAQPKEWTDIPFGLHIPPSGAYGYYWAIVISSTQKNVHSPVNGAVAIPILVTVQKEGMVLKGILEAFTTSKEWYEYPPVTFFTTIRDIGNVHIKPRGNIFITDWQGKQVAVLDINKSAGNILPNSRRIFTSVWDDGFIPNHFDKLLNLRIGKYNAHAIIVISGEKRDTVLEQNASFYVFPWKIVLGAIVFILLAFAGLANTMVSIVKKVKKLFGRKINKISNS